MARTITLIAPSGLTSATLLLVNASDVAQNPITLVERTNAKGVYDGDLAAATIAAGSYFAVLRNGGVPLGTFERVDISGVDPETPFVRDTTNAIGGGSGGSGSQLLTVKTENASAQAVPNVRVEVLATLLVQYTDTQGLCEFRLDPATYTLRFIAPVGWDNPPDEVVTINPGENPTVTVTLTPSSGGAAGTTNVVAQVHINGQPVEGAIVKATLNDPTSAVENDTIVASTVRTEATTDVTGVAQLQLYKGGSFTQGDGSYTIEASHCGKVIWSYSAVMPDLDTVYLPALSAGS